MNNNFFAHITALPENSWTRHFAEKAVADGMAPIAMRDIPERDFSRFARNQRRTCIHNGYVSLPVDEFVRIAHITKSNASLLDPVGAPA